MITFCTYLGDISFLRDDWTRIQPLQFRKGPCLHILEYELGQCHLRGLTVDTDRNSAANIYYALGMLPYEFLVDGEKPFPVPFPEEPMDRILRAENGEEAEEEEDDEPLISYKFSLEGLLTAPLLVRPYGPRLERLAALARLGARFAFTNTLWNEKTCPHFLLDGDPGGDWITHRTELGQELIPPILQDLGETVQVEGEEMPVPWGMCSPKAAWTFLGRPRPLSGIPRMHNGFCFECPDEYLDED